MTFLSIIIPFKKPKRYLKDCLDSLRNQNLEDAEIIIILNGISKDKEDSTNTDTVNALISEYENDLNIVVKSFDDSIGVAKARNIGLDAASGEYVYFIDGDDYIYQDGLERLVKIAGKTNADFINGERIKTHFIRERFKEELVKREYEPIKNTNDLSDMEFAFKIMFYRTKKDPELLTALHCLIKSDIINAENGEKIRFDEDETYYSDYQFMANVIGRCEIFKSSKKSIYAKRRCEDSVNAPTLSEEIKDDEFEYSMNEFEKALKIIDDFDDETKKESLKKEIYRKLYNYYFKTFSHRLYKSDDEAWTNRNFKIICELSQNFDLDAAGKDKKEVLSLQNQDLKTVKKCIGKRRKKSKIKKLITIAKYRNLDAFYKMIYGEIFNKMKIRENRIVFQSLTGDFYSDSPRYIYEYLINNYNGEYDCIWIMNNKNMKIPGKPKTAKRYSLKYFYYIATCKYGVMSGRQSLKIKKRPEQIYLETWHGTPLKKLGLDLENIQSPDPKIKKIYIDNASEWDYLVSPNDYTSRILRSAFGYDGEIIEEGYPRNDILYNEDAELVNKIKDDLNLPKDKKIILYAPTWRDDQYYEGGKYKLDLELDLEKLKEELSDEYVILIRTHYFIVDKLDLTPYKGFAYDASKYGDIAELYLISDILITDYSSVFFDFANLKRPMLFFTYDLDKYENILRGFYIDMENTVPGPLLFTTEEVIDSIKNIDDVNEEYMEKYEEFYNTFCYKDDGKASKRVIERVFKN